MTQMPFGSAFADPAPVARAPLLGLPRAAGRALRRRDAAAAAAARTRAAEAARASAPSPAFAALFGAIEALRTDDRPVVLQLLGADPSCRTGRIVSGLARTARDALDPAALGAAPGPVLLVEAGPAEAAPGLVDCLRRGRDLAEAAVPTGEAGIHRARLGAAALAGPEAGRLLDAIRARFALALIDGGAVAEGGASPPLARHCDGTVLVARAERTRLAAIERARAAIERAGGRLLGAVVEDAGTRLPRALAVRL